MNGFKLAVESLAARFSPERQATRNNSNSRAQWLSVLISGFALALLGAGIPLHAQNPLRKIEFAKDTALSKKLLYWFASSDKSSSARRLFPVANSDGVVSIEIPEQYSKTGSYLKILDVLNRKIAKIPIIQSQPRIPLGPNLLRNGDFSSSFDNWQSEEAGLAKIQQFEIPQGASGTVGKAVQLRVYAIDKEAWHAQFFQNNLDLRDNQPYTLTFMAKADRVRPVTVNGQTDQDDYHPIGLHAVETFTKEWKQYSEVFVASDTVPRHNRLTFVAGDALGAIELSNIKLQEGRALKPVGGNLLRNSDFSDESVGWATNCGKEADAIFSFPTKQQVPLPAGLTGKVFRTEVKKVSRNFYDVQVVQSKREMKDGESYTLSFWAKANKDRPIIAETSVDGENYPQIGLHKEVALTEDWHRFSYSFVAEHTVLNSNRVVFFFGTALGTVDLTHVELHSGVENSKRDGMAEDPALILNEASFQLAETVQIPVTYRGQGVKQATVYLSSGGFDFGSCLLKTTDYGVARFSEVPIGKLLYLTVVHGEKKAAFTRTLLINSPRTLPELDIPANWTKMKVYPHLTQTSTHPLIGEWESYAQQETIIGQQFERYQFSFHPDETGTLVVASFKKDSETQTGIPRSEPFKWSVSEGSQRITLGAHVYTWSIQKLEGTSQLTLKGDNGKTYVLFRN